ncbi:MAG: zinc ribbon domain-containing protein [Myxococcales bacterium]|nr:zinc ribbon domain-containing protein [Myxococcales bacterium]
MRSEEIGTYEMLWDCPHCNTPKLLGIQHRHCPACGAPQDPSARYYPSDEDKVAVEDHVYHGADLICPACTTANAAIARFCVGCGSPIGGDAEAAAARSEQQVGQGEAFGGETSKDALAEARARRDAQRQQAQQAHAGPKPGMSRGLKIGLVVGGVVLVVAVLVFVLFFWKRETTVEVKAVAWERTIEVQEFKEVRDSAWCDEVPSGARKVSRKQEKRSTKKVQDGEECVKKRKDNRDGTFKEIKECKPKFREEPVYDDKCYFEIDRWTTVRTEQARGSSNDPAPSWPAVELREPGTCKGCDREGERAETYSLTFVDLDGESHECEVERAVWDQAEVGAKWKAEVGVVTTSLDCGSFTPAR